MDRKKLATIPKANGKFHAKLKPLFLAAAKATTVRAACKDIGISYQTYYNFGKTKIPSEYTFWRFNQHGINLAVLLKRAGA